MKRLKPIGFEVALLLIAVTSFTLIAASSAHIFTSDDVAQQNAVSAISLHSRPTIDLPQNTYVSKFPLHFIVEALPIEPQAKLVISILVLGLASIGLLYWSIQVLAHRAKWAWTSAAIPLLWLASLGGAFAAAFINPNSRNIEIGLAFAALAIIARWHQNDSALAARNRIWLASYVMLFALLLYDDPYFMYVLAFPLILFFGLRWLLFDRDPKAALIVAAMLAAIIIARVWVGFFWLLGIHTAQVSAVFATLPQVAHNLQIFAASVLDLFNANIFGQPVLGIGILGRELNLLTLLATLFSPALLAWPRIRQTVWRVCPVLQPPFVAMTFVISSYPVDTASERYLVILPFYAAIIFALVLSRLSPSRRMVFAAGLIIAAACNVASTAQAYMRREASPNSQAESVARAVEGLHLTKGYASYWNAGINQYFTNGRVIFIQSGCSRSAGLKLTRVLINEQEWQQSARQSFYLFDPRATRCTRADIDRFLGEPKQVVSLVGERQLLLYDYDILRRMSAQ